MAISQITNKSITDATITAADMATGAVEGAMTTQIGGRRNLIINGSQIVDQRFSGSSELKGSGSQYHTDRFTVFSQAASKITAQQVSEAPAGFKNSLQLTVTNAVTLGATDQYMLQQRIEGQNVAHLAFGTASAETVTLSFYVRSSVTGTHSGVLVNGSENRNYPFTYTISTANTWERISVTIAGDTSGTWVTTNAVGMWVKWNLGTGSTYLGTAGAWSGSSYLSGATGSVQLIETGSATFYITGVQLEVGSVATPFEHRSYGEELQSCLRYFWQITGASGNKDNFAIGMCHNTTQLFAQVHFPVAMRIEPTTVAEFDIQAVVAASGYNVSFNSVSDMHEYGGRVTFNADSGTWTAGNAGIVRVADSASSFISFDAEL